MSMELKGATELKRDITAMADALTASGGGRATTWILQGAAMPILSQMIQNASTDPVARSGKLRGSLKIGKVVRGRSGVYRVTVGVHVADGGAEYANPVEHGHGGPHPAPPHPFVRPAFDAKCEEAYEQMKQNLITALSSRGL